MFNRKMLIVVSVVVLAVMAVPSWGAMFKRTNDQQFVEMCQNGDTKRVIEAIKAGANVNAKDDKFGVTALIFAARDGHTEIVIALIKAGADVNAKSDKGVTALMLAAASKSPKIVKVLIEAGADVNAKDKKGETAWYKAASFGKKENCKLLEEAGAETQKMEIINFLGKNGRRKLSFAALLKGITDGAEDNSWKNYQYKSVEAIQKRIAEGADVNTKDSNGETVLVQAFSWDASPEAMKILIAAGADVNAEMNKKPGRYGTPCKTTALMYATFNKPLAIVKVLLDAGAKVNMIDNCGSTALMYAAEDSTPEVVKLLIDAGADVNAKNNGPKDVKGRTALMEAAGNNYSPDRTGDIAGVLIGAGAELNAQNIEGKTALMEAATWRKIEMVKVLIDAGADVNAKDKRGNTALMLTHSAEIVKMLLDAGADVNAKNNNNRTALKNAVCDDEPEIVKMLLDAGAEGKTEYSPDECWGDMKMDMEEHCGGWC